MINHIQDIPNNLLHHHRTNQYGDTVYDVMTSSGYVTVVDVGGELHYPDNSGYKKISIEL